MVLEIEDASDKIKAGAKATANKASDTDREHGSRIRQGEVQGEVQGKDGLELGFWAPVCKVRLSPSPFFSLH
jgi:hypothetical protein